MKTNRNFWVYLLLSMITCGIYPLFFWRGVEKDVNRMCAGDGKHTMNFWLSFLLGIVTCGIYTIIWYYQLMNRVYWAGPRFSCKMECSGATYLLWTLVGWLLCGVGPLIAVYKHIQDLNAVATAYNAARRAM